MCVSRMFRREINLLVLIVGAIQQHSTVFAFHASLPNRASNGRMIRSDDRTSSTGNGESGIDFIIVLGAGLSAQEAADRMKLQQLDREVMEQEQPPSLFEPELVNEMNAAYSTLEKRFLEGPGSLEESEIDQLEIRFQKIISEMRLNENKRPKKPSAVLRDDTGGATLFDVDAMSTIREEQQQQYTTPISDYKIPSSTTGQSYDTEEDDHGVSDYDGTGGMGQPRGTVNTYAIDGMEEMSSVEYLAALQDRVITTQRERRLSGQAGSRGSWSYLNSLSGSNNNGILNKKKPKWDKNNDNEDSE